MVMTATCDAESRHNRAQAAAWAATMIALRREQEPGLTPDDRAFETALEMMEGTANAVAKTVLGLESSETARRLRAERAALSSTAVRRGST